MNLGKVFIGISFICVVSGLVSSLAIILEMNEGNWRENSYLKGTCNVTDEIVTTSVECRKSCNACSDSVYNIFTPKCDSLYEMKKPGWCVTYVPCNPMCMDKCTDKDNAVRLEACYMNCGVASTYKYKIVVVDEKGKTLDQSLSKTKDFGIGIDVQKQFSGVCWYSLSNKLDVSFVEKSDEYHPSSTFMRYSVSIPLMLISIIGCFAYPLYCYFTQSTSDEYRRVYDTYGYKYGSVDGSEYPIAHTCTPDIMPASVPINV